MNTRTSHKNVLHIILDSMQHGVTVTLLAALPMDVLKTTVDDLLEGCSYALSPLPAIAISAPKLRSRNKGHHRQIEEQNRPFEELAAQWPHYVLPLWYPFGFLDPSIPCAFFTTGPWVEV